MSQDFPPFQDKNPFEVLGLQGTEDVPTIRKAFLNIATKSHPDRLRGKSEEERAQALEVFLGAKKAFETLSQPDKRREWSERLVRLKPAPAPAPPPPAPAPTGTVVITPRGNTLPSAAALQLYKLGLLALEAADYPKALDLFSKATRLAPIPRHQALEQVCFGHQYLSTRFFERARESFERALQLQPDCREARAGLEAIEKQSGRYLKGR
jgi:tetratricopeptide (TPR) repeat protein